MKQVRVFYTTAFEGYPFIIFTHGGGQLSVRAVEKCLCPNGELDESALCQIGPLKFCLGQIGPQLKTGLFLKQKIRVPLPQKLHALTEMLLNYNLVYANVD